jgi:ankyrin repeat protein
MRAILYEKVSAAKVLFGFGADLSKVNGSGGNLLHIAAQGGNNEAINWLLDNSTIDINTSPITIGHTAVVSAMVKGHLDSVKLLSRGGHRYRSLILRAETSSTLLRK